MAKINKFYGQHEDERVLYIIRPHSLVMSLRLIKFVAAALVVFIGFTFISTEIPLGGSVMMVIGVLLALLIGGGGVVMTLFSERSNVAYITDRRVVRFQAENPWVVNSRSLTWDQAVKVKTYAPSLLWRFLNIGTVVVHAKTTIITSDEPKSKAYVSDDDVSLFDVYYYRDLGNYIDKILYMYQRKPEELLTMKPFVTKPRGHRG
jgi:hypothetical protein